MFIRRLASSILALSLLGTAAFASPQPIEPAFADPISAPDRRFAQPPGGVDVSVVTAPDIDRAQVKAALAKRRAQNLAAFTAYRQAGVYPHNFVQEGPLNVWLDQEGRLCAAATIIASSGRLDLAMKQAPINDFIKLADVTDGELMDWILTSGFTQAEIVAIQEPFAGPMSDNPRFMGVVDARRLAEDERLAKRYAQVERMLKKQRAKSLELAVDRLMANPTLAASLLTES